MPSPAHDCIGANDRLAIPLTLQNRSSVNNSFRVNYYVSTNTWISAGDHYVGTRTTTLAPWETRNADIAYVDIDTLSGDFYVGAIVETAPGEQYLSNNTVYLPGGTVTLGDCQ